MEDQQPKQDEGTALNTGSVVTRPDKKLEKKATISLILGIIGMLAWLLPFIGLPVQIVGLIFGIKGLKSGRHSFAVAGITLSIVGLVLTIVNASIGAYLGATGQFMN